LAATNEIGLPSDKAQMVFVAVAAWFGKSAEWLHQMLFDIGGVQVSADFSPTCV
jgi:hypothetical protein